jgi:ParB/RepB/Spo0J family partition protein
MTDEQTAAPDVQAAEEETDAALVTMVPLRDIDVDFKLNISRRKGYTPEEIAEFASEIKRHGLMHPVTIRVNDKDAKKPYKLVAGYKRYAAYSELAKTSEDFLSIPAMLDASQSDNEAVEMNLAENLRRKSIGYLDAAHAIKALEERGFKTVAISKLFGRDASWVRQRKALLELKPKEQTALEQAEMDGEAALRLVFAVKPEQREEVLEEAKSVAKERAAKAAAKGKAEPATKAKVKAQDVTEAVRRKQAAKETASGKTASTRRRLAEVVADFEGEDGPGNSDPVRHILRAFLKYIEGGTTRTLIKNLEAACEGSKFRFPEKPMVKGKAAA